MNGFVAFIKTFGAGRIAAMIAVTAMMIGFFAFIMMRWNSPHLVTLFSDMSLRDSSQVVKELERAGVPYELKFDGTVVQVPSDQVAKLRMSLAEQGLPKGGGVGYEIFDKSEALGTTSFVQNINHLRAMEGELSRSIVEIDKVSSARVHLVMPERQLFSKDKQETTASIVLKLRGSLESAQVKAIQHLVASAVPGMKPASVSIVDEEGHLLATGRGDENEVMAGAMEEKAQGQEARFKSQIEDILNRVVGAGRSKVQVSAELDWNRVTQTQDLFDPESRVVRSTQTNEEKSTSGKGGTNQVSVANEIPGGIVPPGGAGAGGDSNEKTNETVNYEISRTSRTEILEAGRVKRISVAVLVDGTYAKDGDKMNYTPRADDELKRIGDLVRSAIGYDEKRGDKVEIVNLRFADAPAIELAAEEPASMIPKLGMEDYYRIAETAVIFILGLLMLLFGVRPLIKSVLAPTAGATVNAQPSLANASPNEQQAAIAQTLNVTQSVADSTTSKALDNAMANGSLRKESVEKVGELVRNNPNETAAVIRTWMNEKAA